MNSIQLQKDVMLPTPYLSLSSQRRKLFALAPLALALAACGGGGGDPGQVSGTGGTGVTPTPPVVTPPVVPPVVDPATLEPKVEVAVVDGGGSALRLLSGGQVGTVRVKVVDPTGRPAANAIVKFTGDDELITFTPASASALTDANGIATVTIKAASVTASGPVRIEASAVVAGKTTSSDEKSYFNLAIGPAPLTLGPVSFSPAPVGKLPAFSSASLSIPITSGGQPSSIATGLTVTSLCAANGGATVTPGNISNGVVTAVYTNNGCLLGTDVVTVSLGGTIKTTEIGVDAANIGTIQFVSSDLSDSSIVLRGSGGLGRKESALLTYRVLDQNNRGLAGVEVSFRATTSTGGLMVQPDKGTTDANGQVTTTVSSGTIPTPVRVVAEASRNGRTISGLSDALVVSTGLPIQRSLSMSADSYNIEGWQKDGIVANLTIRMADQYGNPISDNTAVNFVTEGGAVGSSAQGACTTVDGGCSVKLRSQNFRPLNGRVSVLAYVQGVENFTDLNGDGQYSCTVFRDAAGNVPKLYRPLIDTCVSGGEPFDDQGDPFLDAGNLAVLSGVRIGGTLDGIYHPTNRDLPFPYNSTTYNGTGNGKWGINYIHAQSEIVFSGSHANLVRQICEEGKGCRDWTTADGDARKIVGLSMDPDRPGPRCEAKSLVFRIHDVNNNPMPSGSEVGTSDAEKVSAGTMYPKEVGSTNAIGGTFHQVTIKPDTSCTPGSFMVTVKTPGGTTTAFTFISAATPPAN